MNLPPPPDNKIVETYLKRWETLENYILQEKSLNLLFHDLCNENRTIENVLLKVSALNDFYSTNVYNTYAVAKHILKCDIDHDLEEGNLDLVNKIALVSMNGKTRNFYSFASKYCSHQKPDFFPIYDSYVVKMLLHFKKQESYVEFKKSDLKIYTKFVEIISAFKTYFNIDNYSLRQIDIYLWLAGKEFFPNKYR